MRERRIEQLLWQFNVVYLIELEATCELPDWDKYPI